MLVRRSSRHSSSRSLGIPLHKRVCVMGILNVTPDSFSDGKKFFNVKSAIARAIAMIDEGADIIDVGGESTRSGALDISVAEELRRVIPVIERIAKISSITISIDTRKSEVASAAVMAGASIINDVSGLKYDDRMAAVAANTGSGLVLMHMKGTPHNMQSRPVYKDVVGDVIRSLKGSIHTARLAGVREDKIIIDPGIGFGKTCAHNLSIIHRLKEFSVLRKPICIGVSRKSFIGKVLGTKDPQARLAGTVAANAVAVMNGASMLRVHDVKEGREAAMIASAILNEKI